MSKEGEPKPPKRTIINKRKLKEMIMIKIKKKNLLAIYAERKVISLISVLLKIK